MATNKEIIVNGVDITGCCWCDFEPNAEPYCRINDGEDLNCEENPNCYYKQLLRLTAQYNSVVEQNKSLQSEFELNEYKQIFGKLAGKTISIASLELPREFCDHKDLTIKHLTQECEELKGDYKELEQRYNEALQDFERLRQKCAELERKHEQCKPFYDLGAKCTQLNEVADGLSRKCDHYKQALEEIEGIATDLRTRTDYHSEDEVNADIDNILTIINEVKDVDIQS